MAPDTAGGPAVTIGQQVGQNLYVKVEQGIGDASQTNFVLEYELTKWLRMRTNVLQGSSTQRSCSSGCRAAASTCYFSSATSQDLTKPRST